MLSLRVPTAALGTVALAAGLLTAAPASAVIVDSGEISGDRQVVLQDFCGVPGLTVVADGTVTERWRAVRRGGPDGLAYYTWQGRYEWRYTNQANGRYVVEKGVQAQVDRDVVDNGDGTLTIEIQAAGGTRLLDPDGRLVGANPGQLRYAIMVAHNGTPSDPTDDQFLAFLGETRGSTGRNDDFCGSGLPHLL